MDNIKEKVKFKIQKLRQTGFFAIFIATILSKVVTLLGGIILVRVLSKNDYGIYSYVCNCFSMLFIVNDLGISSAALQYLTENIENKEKQNTILKYSIISSLIVACVTSILIILSPYFYPYTMQEGKSITPMLFIMPFITIMNGLLSVVLRSNFENKKYSILQIFTTIVTYLILITFSLIWGVNGAILSQYVYSSIILIYSLYLTKGYLCKIKETKIKLNKDEKKGFIKYALACEMNNAISSLLLIIDTFLIGYMVTDKIQIANYSVGSKLPYALTFLSNCVAIYIIPHFVKNNKNIKWVEKNSKLVVKYSLIGFGIMCIFLILLAKPIFKIVFGTQYYEAIPIYITLVIGLFFTSAIKVPCANILAALKKLKINIVVNVICIIINFISNIIFIKKMGIVGAAITTTITNIISATICYIYLKVYIKKSKKIIKKD